MKILQILAKDFFKAVREPFPVVHCFTRKQLFTRLDFFSNVLSLVVSGNISLLLTHPRPRQT